MPSRPSDSTKRDPRSGPTFLPMWAYVFGLAAIIVALGASGALVWKHFSGKSLPGCGTGETAGTIALEKAQSACAQLEAHPMGSLGGMWTWYQARAKGEKLEKVTPQQAVWPVSFLGSAYSAAALAAWIVIGVKHRRVGSVIPWVARLGGLISIVYLAVIVVTDKLCPYCITSHIANLALVGFLESGMFMSKSGGVVKEKFAGWGAVAAALVVFGVSAGAMGAAESSRREKVAASAKREADAAAEAIRAKIEQDRKAAEQAAKEPKPEALPWGTGGFTGRWTYGPKEAPVRIVTMTSYQCPQCRQIEDELFKLVEKHKGKISISQVHFPFCDTCNKYSTGCMHDKSCWAARAAEAAAIIAGSKAALTGEDQKTAANAAFWKLHKWLFSKGGNFTDLDLKQALPELGFDDIDQFMKVMTGKPTEDLVRGDTEIAASVGLQETPMIYINGIEFRGWQNLPSLITAIEQMVASNPPVIGPQNDRPILAKEKYVEDWRQERIVNMGAEPAGRTLGAADANAVLTIWADFTEPNTKKVYETIKPWVKTKSVRIVWRHFPGTKACNPSLPKDFFPNGCVAANAVEQALAAGGSEGFWKMGEWLMANQEGATASRVKIASAVLGLDEAKYEAAAGAASQAVAADVQFARQINVDRIPKIYVNGKWVRQWITDDQKDVVLERIVDEAAAKK